MHLGLTDKKPFKVIESKQSEKKANKAVKNKGTSKQPDTVGQATKKRSAKTTFKSIIGIILIGMSVSVYVQALPLTIIFLGGMLGIPVKTEAAPADMLVWGVSGIGIAGLVTYSLIRLCGVIWHGMVKQKHK